MIIATYVIVNIITERDKIMKTIRIGSGAGYAGDRIEPAIDLIKHGKLDYIIFETLAERTIALAQKEKKTDSSKGFNNLLEYRFKRIFEIDKHLPVKIITNMGAANPLHAAKKIKEIAINSGVKKIKIAAVIGDDVSQCISDFFDFNTIETNESLSVYKDKIISANAYTGCSGIVQALKDDADIIITGRVSDPSLVVAPLIYEFEKKMNDYDFLGKATIAGHLLECAGQVCGGYFADPGYKDIDNLWNLGFPIAEINELGDIVITKLPTSGGKVTKETVTEQLLYEIQNPSEYITPDVVADISNATVEEIDKDKVLIKDVTGHPKTNFLKVSVGYEAGYLSENEISYGGFNCLKRAELAEDIIKKRINFLKYSFKEIRYDFIGINSLFKTEKNNEYGQFNSSNINEIRLRIAGRSEDLTTAICLGNEVEALYTNGPAAGGGVRRHVTELVSIISILIPESIVNQTVIMEGF